MPDPILKLRTRNHVPSGAVAVGTVGGGAVGTVAVWLLGLFGVPVPAEVAVALGSVLSGCIGYFMRSGRRQ